MRARTRWLVFSVALVGLVGLAAPSSADHWTRSDVRNLEPIADLSNTDTLANSDMAFWGDLAFQGHWEGWQVHDISDPTSPRTLLDYVHCTDPTLGIGGGQGDIIVWNNLLVRAWNSGATSSGVCGTNPDGSPTPIQRVGFEGIHIFDISDVARPRLITGVDIDDGAPSKPPGVTTGCGSHTLTAVPDPANNRLLVYVGGSSTACPGMDLVEIPLGNPAAATWYGRAEAGRSCHDITVYMVDKLRAACSGSVPGAPPPGQHGFTYFSMDPAQGGSLRNPVQLYQRNVPNTTTVGHTSAFSWDGKILSWSHEPGGGVQSACETTDPPANREMYFFSTETGSMKGKFTIPAQTVDESCASVHIMQSIPTLNGLDVFTSGNYMAGTYLVDYTDPTAPRTIGWSDPPPNRVPEPNPNFILGGAWATYWYNGFLYESDIAKGLHIHRSTSPEAQTPMRLPYLNPQTMLPLPPLPAACKGKPATLVGTAAKDTIVGTTGNDVIAGLGANDVLNGRGGKDTICAGGGNDKVKGAGGNDRLFGQAGRDKLNGGGGNDLCVGGGGRDKAKSCEKQKSIP